MSTIHPAWRNGELWQEPAERASDGAIEDLVDEFDRYAGTEKLAAHAGKPGWVALRPFAGNVRPDAAESGSG